MARKSLTHGTKRDIHESIDRREKQLQDRLSHIPDSGTHPSSWDKRLNEPKRFEVAAVFIDIDEFHNYLLKNGPRATMFMLGLFIPEAMRVINEYDGHFEKNTGDGLLAYFGFGKSATESIADLLQYITTVRWIISEEINPRLKNHGISPISVSSGSTYGDVYLANIGVRSIKRDLTRLTAVSSQVNSAFLLENEASPNEHLVGPAVEYHADKEDQQYLQFHHVLGNVYWTNPATGQEEPFMIYEYTGEWQEDGSSVAEGEV